MVTSQVMSESLGWPPGVGTWLHIGRNSRASHSKVKEGQSREKTGYTESLGHTRVWGYQCSRGGGHFIG